MSSAIDAGPIAFRIGQIDALARCLLASPTTYPAETRTALALRWLRRAWEQYRQDRAITLGPALIGAECAAERNAFLTAGGKARRDTLDAFRFLMSEGNVPMVVAGLDVAADIFAEDVELAYRSIILKLKLWPPGEPSQQLILALARGMHMLEPDRFSEPDTAEFIWRHSRGVTGNFKRLLHWGGKIAKDDGRQRVEFDDLRAAAAMLPALA